MTIPTMPEVWHCPVADRDVPKGYVANLAYRENLLRTTTSKSDIQAEISACSHSLLYWLNSYVFTESFFQVVDGRSVTRVDKKYPFITWPAQDSLLLKLDRCIENGESLLLEKSREVGATWCVLAVFTHKLLFSKKPRQFSMLSLKEDDVDQLAGEASNYPWGTLSDSATLFGKIDYALRHLPLWMTAPLARKRMHLVRTDTRSRIDGGASGAFALSSQRRDGVLYDEAAKNENFKTSWEGTRDVAKCRIAVSTPVGYGTYFTELRNSGTIPTMELGWWDDPNKAAGMEIEPLPGGTFRRTSPWYRNECALRTPVDIASNLDIKHLESGQTFFNIVSLKNYKKKFCVPEVSRIRLDFSPDVPDSKIPEAIIMRDTRQIIANPDPRGPWRLWFKPVESNGKLESTPMGGNLVFGIDVAMGTGASNSVISVIDKGSRIKLAEFSDANTPPYRLARIAIAAAIWFGQRARPLMIPEANGVAGFDFLRQLAKVYRYPNIYTEKPVLDKMERLTTSLGYHSSRPKKAVLLGNLSRAYMSENFTNPSESSLDEALQYIIFENGQLGPAYLMRESEDAKATHGDRVIADALAIWAGNESFAWREDRRLKQMASPTIEIDIMKGRFTNQRQAGWRFQHANEVYAKKTRRRLEDIAPGTKINLNEFL